MHLFRLGATRHGPAANAVAAVGLVSSMLPGALRGSLREAAETQRASAIIRLPSGRNARVVCAVTPLHPSDPDSPEQGGCTGGGARVLVASGAFVASPVSPACALLCAGVATVANQS